MMCNQNKTNSIKIQFFKKDDGGARGRSLQWNQEKTSSFVFYYMLHLNFTDWSSVSLGCIALAHRNNTGTATNGRKVQNHEIENNHTWTCWTIPSFLNKIVDLENTIQCKKYHNVFSNNYNYVTDAKGINYKKMWNYETKWFFYAIAVKM